MRFVIGKVLLGQVFLQVLLLALVSTMSQLSCSTECTIVASGIIAANKTFSFFLPSFLYLSHKINANFSSTLSQFPSAYCHIN